MKQYLQILIIGILIFSSNCVYQYTCSVSGTGQNDGFYNAPIGAGGICTNTGVCQGSFSETPNYPKTPGKLTGDCFHCKQANRFLDRPQQVQSVRCSRYGCQTGYTDSSAGEAASYPLQGNCQNCVNGLVNKNGVCECQNEDEYLVNSYSGRCGTKCDEGYVQYRNGVHLSVQFTHCLFCHYGLENNNGRCTCAINGQYLTKPGYNKCGEQCETNFTYNSNGSPPSPTITGHCFTCITGHTYYNRKCSPSCPTGQYYINFNPICGSSCAPGYSDQWFAPQSTTLQGNCGHCLRGLILTSGVSGCTCRQISQYLTSITSNKCGRTCVSGYTYYSDGRVPDSPTHDHCVYCLAGLQKNNNVCECENGQYLTSTTSDTCGRTCDFSYTDQSDGSAANSPSTGHCLYCRSTHSIFQGQCLQKCRNGQYFTNYDGGCGTSCSNGYTDLYTGLIPSSTIGGDCKYCLRGLVLKRFSGCQCSTDDQYLTSITSESCGTTCDQGYTHDIDGRAPNTPSTGHCFYCVSATHSMYKGKCQTSCQDGFYHTQFDGTCGTSCATGYTDQSDGSPPTFPLRANCQYCLSSSDFYLNRPKGICSLKCEDGYTDKSNRQPPSTILRDDCSNCVTGLKNRNGVCQCARSTFYLISLTNRKCSNYCVFPFTYFTDGSIAVYPNRVGHCFYCIAGLEFKNGKCRCTNQFNGLTNPNSGVCGKDCDYGYTNYLNGIAPKSPTTGNCRYCIAGLYQRQGYYCNCREDGEYLTSLTSATCGTTCVFGYTDKLDGSDPNSPTSEHCKYCISILEKKNGACNCPISNQYLISNYQKQCGTTCTNGYTDQSNGGTPDQPLTGHCLYQRKCRNGQYFTQINERCATGTCVPGYTDQSDRSAASDPIRKDCKYCLYGLKNKNGICECQNRHEFLMDSINGICGSSCAFGYTHFNQGVPPLNPSIGHCLYCQSGFTLNNEGKCEQ